MSFNQGLTILFIIAILIWAMGFTLLQLTNDAKHISLDSMDENHESKEGSDECQKKN